MYNPMELQRIDRQIEDLQRLKANFQNMGMGQPPINNIITTPQQAPQPIFEAKFTNENPSDILVSNKTAFINLRDGKLSIKEVDGEIKEYFIILPKDEKDLKIENLESKLREMEIKLNQFQSAPSMNLLNPPQNTMNVSQNNMNNIVKDETTTSNSNNNNNKEKDTFFNSRKNKQ